MNDVASEDDDPLLDEVVDDRFRLDEKLGEGAVGRVYRATQLSIERSVAIKVLHGEFRRDEEYQKRFRREARAISSFNHPNIVRLVEYGEDEQKGLTYLAMEFVEGLELYDILEKGRVDPRCALEVTSQVAAGLSAAHEADIVHRDLKASNIILVSVPGGIFQAKVLDFGVAFPKNQSKRMTTDGEVFGTPAYMSPEQAQGKPVDEQSDIYSLGIVLFEMLTGTLPFDGENTVELMVKHLQNEPPRLEEVHPAQTFPKDLQQLLDTLLAKESDDRPASGDIVRDRIETIRNANDWGNLHVDSNASLEEALSKWILPPGDSRLTTQQATGRPGSGREHSLGPQQRQTAIDGDSNDVSTDTATGSAGTRSEQPSSARETDTSPPASGRFDSGESGSSGSQPDEPIRTEAPSDEETAFAVSSPGRSNLTIVVGVIGVLAVVAAGVFTAYLVFKGGEEETASTDGDQAQVAAGANPTDTGGTSGADSQPPSRADTGDVSTDAGADVDGGDEGVPTTAESSDESPTQNRASSGASSDDSERSRSGGVGSGTAPGRTGGRDRQYRGANDEQDDSSAGSKETTDQQSSDNDNNLDKKLKQELDDLDDPEY